jgi:hypothetical protein
VQVVLQFSADEQGLVYADRSEPEAAIRIEQFVELAGRCSSHSCDADLREELCSRYSDRALASIIFVSAA